MIWDSLKSDAMRLIRSHSGERFTAHYDANHRLRSNPLRRAAALALAGALMLAGFILCFIPGPGTPFLLLGMAVLASQNRSFAAFLDRLELRLAAWWNHYRLTERLNRVRREVERRWPRR